MSKKSIQELLHTGVVQIQINWEKYPSKMGTGFFYFHLSDEMLEKAGQPGWISVDKQYLVTAKHCIVEPVEGVEEFPEEIIIFFNMPPVKGGDAKTLNEKMTREDLQDAAFFHGDPSVDIVIIDLSKSMSKYSEGYDGWKGANTLEMIQKRGFNRSHLLRNNKYFDPEAGDSVVVVGYPYGYHDSHNKFPVLKSGIIASAWGLNFDDESMFKVDVQLFPVSSGSPVLLEPTNLAFIDGKMHTNAVKQTALLGVYTGEWRKTIKEDCVIIDKGARREIQIEKKVTLGVGSAHYADLIEEIVLNPVSWEEYKKK